MAIEALRKGEMFVCKTCGKEFFVPQYAINYRPTIKYCSTNCYHSATRKQPTIRNCLYCGTEFIVQTKHKDKKFCNTKCACAYKSAQSRKPTLGANGYKYVWFSDGSGEREHRFIMEQTIGRKLNRDEIVHHLDGNRSNNDISNLVIMSRKEHSRIHRKMELESGKKLFGG